MRRADESHERNQQHQQRPGFGYQHHQQQQQQQQFQSYHQLQQQHHYAGYYMAQPWHFPQGQQVVQQHWHQNPQGNIVQQNHTNTPSSSFQNSPKTTTPKELNKKERSNGNKKKSSKRLEQKVDVGESIHQEIGEILPPGTSPPSSPAPAVREEGNKQDIKGEQHDDLESGRKRDRDDNEDAASKKRPKQQRQQGVKGNKGRKGLKGQTFGGLTVPLAPRYLEAHKTGTSPEEVAKWREARRRNYPTKANMERKEKELQVKPQVTNNIENTEEEEPISSTIVPDEPRKGEDEPRVCKRFIRGNCRFGRRCKFAHSNEAKTQHLISQRKSAETKRFLQATARPGGKPSLLHQLLASDIHKERTVVLECIHHLLRTKALEQQRDASVEKL